MLNNAITVEMMSMMMKALPLSKIKYKAMQIHLWFSFNLLIIIIEGFN